MGRPNVGGAHRFAHPSSKSTGAWVTACSASRLLGTGSIAYTGAAALPRPCPAVRPNWNEAQFCGKRQTVG
jgi:hypothetical protein